MEEVSPGEDRVNELLLGLSVEGPVLGEKDVQHNSARPDVASDRVLRTQHNLKTEVMLEEVYILYSAFSIPIYKPFVRIF